MALGAAVLSPLHNVSDLHAGAIASESKVSEPAHKILTSSRETLRNGAQPDAWSLIFSDEKGELTLQNGAIKLQGVLRFTSEGTEWKVGSSRDGVPHRNTLVDPRGDVQGYWIANCDGTRLELLFYHRTAQRFAGRISFEGTLTFAEDGFACRTRPNAGERVLHMRCGPADSLQNDSLFSPENDLLLQVDAAQCAIETLRNGSFALRMSGRIEEASESRMIVRLEEGYFRKRYVPYYAPLNRKRCPVAPTGWMSWNTYFDKATAEDNLAEARIGKEYLQPFGCEFWSIESWQGNSDQLPVSGFYNMNLEVNEKQFPKGMKALADEIRKLGFRPGLWTAPFGTGNEVFYQAHRNWFLHDKEGKPVSSWNGKYTLDPTVTEAREHLKEIHRIASREWGFEYFKIDGMSGRNSGYCAHLYERPEIRACFSDPACPNPFDLCVKAFREGIGDDRVFLACQGHTSGPEALYADASRIGADIVQPNQPVRWSGVMNQAGCLANQLFTHNIVMIADPDTLLVRDLPLEEARTSATLVALPGQLTFFGDKLTGLDPLRMKILQQTLPVAEVLPGNLYPIFSMVPVWNLRVRNRWIGPYNVVAFFNWDDQEQTLSVTPEELGISRIDYTGFEFWEQHPVNFGATDPNLSMSVPPHAVRLVALHPVQTIPQWLSSDRHIAQHGPEILEMAWDAEKSETTGTLELIGQFSLTLRFRIPPPYRYAKISCKEATCQATQNGEILTVTMQNKKQKAGRTEARFTLQCIKESNQVSSLLP